MFPRLVLIVIGFISIFGILRAIFAGQSATETGTLVLPLVPFFSIVAVLCIFVILFTTLGSEIAIFSLIGGGVWYRSRRIGLAILIGLVSVFVFYIVFAQALSVRLPLMFLPRYLFTGL